MPHACMLLRVSCVYKRTCYMDSQATPLGRSWLKDEALTQQHQPPAMAPTESYSIARISFAKTLCSLLRLARLFRELGLTKCRTSSLLNSCTRTPTACQAHLHSHRCTTYSFTFTDGTFASDKVTHVPLVAAHEGFLCCRSAKLESKGAS